MKSALKTGFFAITWANLSRDRASVLMYHSISDNPNHFNSVAPGDFEHQMDYLARRKTPVISLVELVRRLRARERLGGAVVLTFDDGFRNNYTTALPILKEHNFCATVFVTTELLGRVHAQWDLEYLGKEEVSQMAASSLIAIGAHTKTHPKLTNVSAENAQIEIAESKSILEGIVGKNIELFAYPHGTYNDTIKQFVQQNGFTGAVTVREGTVGPGTDPFEIPRNSIDASTTFSEFRGKISRAIDWYNKLKV